MITASQNNSCHFTPFHVSLSVIPGPVPDSGVRYHFHGNSYSKLPVQNGYSVPTYLRYPYLRFLRSRGNPLPPLAGIFTNSAPLRRSRPRKCSRRHPLPAHYHAVRLTKRRFDWSQTYDAFCSRPSSPISSVSPRHSIHLRLVFATAEHSRSLSMA